MAIAQDASTPVPVQRAYGTSGTAATTSFSPPAGSWAYIMVAWMFGTGASSTLSCKDSLNNAYTGGPSRLNASNSDIQIFSRYYATAPGPITVTVTCTSTSGASVELTPLVLTGANPTQATPGTGSAAAGTVAVTTTQTGSWVLLAGASGTAGTMTPNAATTTINAFNDAANSGDNGISGRATSATGTPGATTLGWTAGVTSIVALEVLPAVAATAGPQIYPLQQPAGNARRSAGPQRTGRAQSNPGHVTPFVPPTSGPQLYPLRGPIQARPQFPVLNGRAKGRRGIFTAGTQTAGPPLSASHGAVRAPIPPQPPGSGCARTGLTVKVTTGTGAAPAYHPGILGPIMRPLTAPGGSGSTSGTSLAYRSSGMLSRYGRSFSTVPSPVTPSGPVTPARGLLLTFPF